MKVKMNSVNKCYILCSENVKELHIMNENKKLFEEAFEYFKYEPLTEYTRQVIENVMISVYNNICNNEVLFEFDKIIDAFSLDNL